MNATNITLGRGGGLSLGLGRGVLALLLGGLGWGIAAGADISGTYGARGVQVTGGEGAAEVSLPALLHLEANAELGLARRAGDDLVVIAESEHAVEIHVLDREGNETWRAHWREGRGFDRAGDQRRLSVTGTRPKEVAWQFLFESLEGGQLLRLEVARLVATSFGPVSEPVGTYIFYRTP